MYAILGRYWENTILRDANYDIRKQDNEVAFIKAVRSEDVDEFTNMLKACYTSIPYDWVNFTTPHTPPIHEPVPP